MRNPLALAVAVMKNSDALAYFDWVDAFDAQVGAFYPEPDDMPDFYCGGCSAILPSADARCLGCNPYDEESQLDLVYHDALWPSEYGDPNAPGADPSISYAIYQSMFGGR